MRSSSTSCRSVLALATLFLASDQYEAPVRQHVPNKRISLFTKFSKLHRTQLDEIHVTTNVAPDSADAAT